MPYINVEAGRTADVTGAVTAIVYILLVIALFTARAVGRIRRIDAATGIITTVAGIGLPGYTGDGGPATQARIGGLIDPYQAQWLEFHLERVRPRKGWNELLIIVEKRAEGLEGGITVNDVEVIVEYGPYPSGASEPGG